MKGKIKVNGILSDADLRRIAPSIFAEKAAADVTKRYTFIPTIDVVNAFRKEGFLPSFAVQSQCRLPDNREYTKHMIRFCRTEDVKWRQPQDVSAYDARGTHGKHGFYKAPPAIVEIVLGNAHDRTSRYWIKPGVYRLLCSNGLMVACGDIPGASITHSGDVVQEALERSVQIIGESALIANRIERWQAQKLDEEQQLTFATAALIDRYGLDANNNLNTALEPEALLQVRRESDKERNLWTTMNVVQENLMRGGISALNAKGHTIRTREIKSVDRTVAVNESVWSIAEAMSA
jgi:hypothetical protein